MRPHLATALLLALALAATAAEPLKNSKPETQNPKPETAAAPRPASYADIIEPAQQAVVSVYSTKIIRERLPINPLYREFYGDRVPERETKEQGIGSGVIVSPDGYILTNHHVVEGADELNVSLPDNREYKARIIGTDPKTDIAVLKIDAAGLPTLALADSDQLRVGDLVFAVGNPLGIGQTVTMGIVSAKGRNNLGLLENVGGYENFIQTDASINQGNSGGALIDARGRLVGINSAIISNTRGNIGIGLAIPANLAATILHNLVETGTVARGYLGVQVEPLTPDIAETLSLPRDTRAVVVTHINPGSPAEKAGLQRSDAILSIDNRPITSLQDLRFHIAQLPPDTAITLKIRRDGKEKLIPARLGRLADDTAAGQLLPGVETVALDADLRRALRLDKRATGLLITEVAPDSPYADRLAPDTIILEINRQPVTDLDTARRLLQPGRNLLLVYTRGAYRYVPILVKG